ncbi:MAG TPA: MmgE/PrpD family protein [Vicinamibacterales bacterium]|nr:MmgE/PrpD family protein [Vicinamibacterales bacterium]
MASSATLALARFVVDTRDVPSPVLAAMQDALIDTLACGLAGAYEPCVGIATRCIGEGSAVASVWGTQRLVASGDAAFANGIAAHALDFDDTLASMRGHSSVTTVPVALAIGEKVGASGQDVLVALVMGLEIAGKVGRALGHGHYLRGWHSTATVGPFAAAAVAAKLLGHDAAQLCDAWGLAAAQAAGLVRNFGTMAKPFQAGHAARAGIFAAELAGAGMTADRAIFDGPDGFPETYAADGPKLGELLPLLGERWEALDPGLNFKRWPCCYACHRALGGLMSMLDESEISGDDVVEVAIGFPPGSDEPLIHTEPKTGLEAKFSIEYPVAALLLDGKLDLASFTDQMVCRPEAREMMRRVRRVPLADSGTFSGTIGYTDVEIRTRSGSWSRRISKAPGSREWPVAPAERQAKFFDCAANVLSAERARDLIGVLANIGAVRNIRELTRMMRVPDQPFRTNDPRVPPTMVARCAPSSRQ